MKYKTGDDVKIGDLVCVQFAGEVVAFEVAGGVHIRCQPNRAGEVLELHGVDPATVTFGRRATVVCYTTGDAAMVGDVVSGWLVGYDVRARVVAVGRSGVVVDCEGSTWGVSLDELARGGVGLVRRAEVSP